MCRRALSCIWYASDPYRQMIRSTSAITHTHTHTPCGTCKRNKHAASEETPTVELQVWRPATNACFIHPNDWARRADKHISNTICNPILPRHVTESLHRLCMRTECSRTLHNLSAGSLTGPGRYSCGRDGRGCIYIYMANFDIHIHYQRGGQMDGRGAHSSPISGCVRWKCRAHLHDT